MTRKKHIFICYCREDIDEVRYLVQALEENGKTVYWDQNLNPGEDWRLAIRKAIADACAAIICISRNLDNKKYSFVFEELRQATTRYRQLHPEKNFIIPVRITECEIPFIELDTISTLRDLHHVDLFPQSNWQQAFQKIMTSLQQCG